MASARRVVPPRDVSDPFPNKRMWIVMRWSTAPEIACVPRGSHLTRTVRPGAVRAWHDAVMVSLAFKRRCIHDADAAADDRLEARFAAGPSLMLRNSETYQLG